MKEKLQLIIKHLRQGSLQKMWKQTIWIYQYGKRYWKSMILYTLLGVMGSCVSLASSLISKDLVDIITGHQTGRLLSTFAAMIGFAIANLLVSQASGYASTFISLKVDSEIKNDIFAKMLVTDWESLTEYHTGDLVTRWSSDASNISSGILNWVPNLIIYTFRFISALAVVLYQRTGNRAVLRSDLCPVCTSRYPVQCPDVASAAAQNAEQQPEKCCHECQNVWFQSGGFLQYPDDQGI